MKTSHTLSKNPETRFSHMSCGGEKSAQLLTGSNRESGGLLTGTSSHSPGSTNAGLIPPLLLAA